jgi:Pyruvate phosphate dikinase, AMP/ATP-binding domain
VPRPSPVDWTLAPFARGTSDPSVPATAIGKGEIGGKARGLVDVHDVIVSRLDPVALGGVQVAIPPFVVIATDMFDAFVARNGLAEQAPLDLSDEGIARTFVRAELPNELIGDLRAVIEICRFPLAVRSSSRLEDAAGRPLAGVYATKMIPNRQPDAEFRFRQLVEAVKLVWASTYFADARAYRRTIGHDDEKMAVIVQPIVGRQHGDRFYPDVSGVARSINYYPAGDGRREDGVVELALGMGKWIVDGEPAWSYSPVLPKAPPPFNDFGDMLRFTQTAFWAVNLGTPPYDPTKETEYLLRCHLAAAEEDDTARLVASTFDPHSRCLVPGVGRKGPLVLDFAPLLRYSVAPLNDTVRATLAACEDASGGPVEIEFALTLEPSATTPARFGFLQVRPLVTTTGIVEVSEHELTGDGVLVATDRALGNGLVADVLDIVYVRPERFDRAASRSVAQEVGELNAVLVAAARPFLLVGPGRWGTSDPWGGIPVAWAQISGARCIVEAQIAGVQPDLSQGSHFFHNLTSFGVTYFSVAHGSTFGVDWGWLERQPADRETAHLRHIHLARPLVIKADGRSGRGVVCHD